MKEPKQNFYKFDNNSMFFQRLFIAVSISLCFCISIFLLIQNSQVSSQTKSKYRVGERLTYNISFEKYKDAAYAEIYVVSRGQLGGKDAVELSAKIKSDGVVSAAFYLLDEARTAFVSDETGLPLYVRTVSKASGLPKENISNFLKAPTTNYDLLSMVYKVRQSGGAGSFSVQENEKIYNFDFAATGGEVVTTDAGEFETTISTVQSNYLSELEITDFRVNFTNDEKRMPVLISFQTAKGKFVAEIASVQNLSPEIKTEISPTTKPTAIPKRTPKAIPTPTPYIINQSLSDELPFSLGETLVYQVTKQGQNLGKVTVQATERSQFNKLDSLLLTAKVTELGQGNQVFVLNDGITARVDPYSLAPINIDLKFTNSLSLFNQTTSFNQTQGIAINKGKGSQRIDIPVGTHSILSLAYAIRSFNLKRSLDPQNPVNDTRVAVFLGDKTFVFTLKPQAAKVIKLNGKKVSAQEVSIRTGNRSIDRLNLRLWLSNDKKRVPLRLAVGAYRADLIEAKIELTKKP